MTFFARPVALLASATLLVAGCGGGDEGPHPVDQPVPTSSQTLSPGEVGVSGSLATEQSPSLEPSDQLDQDAINRRSFWTGPRRRPFGEWTMRQTAIDSLARIGQPAVPALVDLLSEPEAKLRADAVIALARIGPDARGALPKLIELVQNDPDEAVRKHAVRALGQIGPDAAPAVSVLIEQVRAGSDMPNRSGRATGGARPADDR